MPPFNMNIGKGSLEICSLRSTRGRPRRLERVAGVHICEFWFALGLLMRRFGLGHARFLLLDGFVTQLIGTGLVPAVNLSVCV